jgi:hypothetical protein
MMKAKPIVGTVAAIAGSALALATAAQAAADAQFLSPDGKIACSMSQMNDGGGQAVCDISSDNGFNAQLPMYCPSGGLVRFVLNQGQRTQLQCDRGDVNHSLNTLSDGQTRSVGLIDCVPGSGGVECSDRASQHYFRIYMDHYEIG